MSVRWQLASATVVVVALGCGETSAPPREAPPPVTLEARRAPAPRIDGELEERDWISAPRTERFVDAIEGTRTTPYTQARVLFDDEALTLALYAADEDVRSTDRMGAVLHAPGGATFVVEIAPTGALRWHAPSAPAVSPPDGVVAAIDADATLDVDDLEDEEWVAEIRVPWRALGMEGPGDVRANFFRRDRPRDSLLRSLAWTPWRTRPSAAIETLGLVHCGEVSVEVARR